jgi:hypothetical protein
MNRRAFLASLGLAPLDEASMVNDARKRFLSSGCGFAALAERLRPWARFKFYITTGIWPPEY